MSEITHEMVSMIKGMLKRNDKQQDIAACFCINSARVAEIKSGEKHSDVQSAPSEALPPVPPYPSPYDLWKAKHALWAARVALEAVMDTVEKATVAVKNAEKRV